MKDDDRIGSIRLASVFVLIFRTISSQPALILLPLIRGPKRVENATLDNDGNQ